MRTLLLMCRAGLIQLDIEDAENTVADEGADAITAIEAMAAVRIRILDHGHLLSSVWEDRVNPAREKAFVSAKRNLRLLVQMLEQRREVSHVLAELYRIDDLRWPVRVTRVCGGCPADRTTDDVPRTYHPPGAAPISRVTPPSTVSWHSYFPWLDGSPVYVFFDAAMAASALNRLLLGFVGWLVSVCSVREVAAQQHSRVGATTARAELYKRSPDGFVIHRPIEESCDEPYTPIARATLLEPGATSHLVVAIGNLQRPFHVILLPMDTRDPVNHSRHYVHTASNGIRLNEIWERLTQ
jgi:hypothetical protein